MGTHIDVLFPRRPEVTEKNLSQYLTRAFSESTPSLLTIKDHAWYSIDFHPWPVATYPAEGNEPAYVEVDGPYGFDITLYEQVGGLGHPERFSRLYSTDSPVSASLQRVIQSVVSSLANPVLFAGVAGGMGDSDHAIDLAYYQGADFTTVCKLLEAKLGPPATAWDALDSYRWMLGSNGDA